MVPRAERLDVTVAYEPLVRGVEAVGRRLSTVSRGGGGETLTRLQVLRRRFQKHCDEKDLSEEVHE